MTRSGSLIYTDFAFATDAKEAMRGKIDRALIELITNADDAYGDMPGSITIKVDKSSDPFAYEVSVFDSAIGISSFSITTDEPTLMVPFVDLFMMSFVSLIIYEACFVAWIFLRQR